MKSTSVMETTPVLETVASTLTVLLVARQVAEGAEPPQTVPEEKSPVYVVVEETAPVRTPCVAEVIVRLLLFFVVMTPVKSSMDSSVPVVCPVRGSETVVTAFVAAKLKVMALLAVVMMLLRLKSMPRPAFWFAVKTRLCAKVIVIEPGVPPFRLQTVPVGQALTVDPDPFAQTVDGASRKICMEVYVSAGI